MIDTDTDPARKPAPAGKKPRLLQALLAALIVALILGITLTARYALWVMVVNQGLDSLERGELAKARDKAQESISMMSWLRDDASYALSLRMLTSVYGCRRLFPQAEAHIAKLLDFDRAAWGENSAQYAGDLSDLALMKRKQRSWDEAERLYRQVIEIYRGCAGKEVERAHMEALLAWVLIQKGQIAEASKLIEDSDQILNAKYGPKHWQRLVGVVESAYILKQKDDKESFDKRADLAYEIATKPQELDKSSAQTVVVLNLLAQMFADMGESEKALKMFTVAENNCKTSAFGGPFNSYMSDIFEPHAQLLENLGRKDEAVALRKQSKRVREARL